MAIEEDYKKNQQIKLKEESKKTFENNFERLDKKKKTSIGIFSVAFRVSGWEKQ